MPADASNPPADCAAFALKDITDLFPAELKTSLRKQPSEHVRIFIPRTLIQPQLAAGAVRITFGQLCAAAPEIFFHPDGAPANTKVLLPLENVLRQMMPSRREDQRQPAIPVNIPSIFLKAGGPSPARGSTEGWYSQRRPTYEAEPQPDPNPAPAAPSNQRKPAAPIAPPPPARPPRKLEPAIAPPISPIGPIGPIGPISAASAPAKIIERIRALAGVAGAFLATADGLLIAGDVPQGNENILAAFAPTVFAQLTKYSDMAHLGLPESIDIRLGDGTTVHVRKTGRLFLGVLMPPGHPLPAQELTRIADSIQPRTS